MNSSTIVVLFVLSALLCSTLCSATPRSKVFVKTTQGLSGIAGIISLPNGNIAMACNPKDLCEFNPATKKIVSRFTYPDYSFIDDMALVPFGGISATSFLDGYIPTLFPNKTLLQSNTANQVPAPGTGSYNAKFSPQLLGANPITYYNGNLYIVGLFDFSTIYKLDWRGGVPIPITLNAPVGFNAFQFGPDGALYAPDSFNNQIVKIVIEPTTNTGVVTPFITGIQYPVALKVDSSGNIYFITRAEAKLYKYIISTGELQLLATLEPPLDNLCLSFEQNQNQIYVSNNDNTLYRYNQKTKVLQTLISSALSFPWDIKYDRATKRLYVADSSSVKVYKVNGFGNAKLDKKIVLDSNDNPELIGFGNVFGISTDDDKIVIVDGSIGSFAVLHKNYTVEKVYGAFSDNTGLALAQPYSVVRVSDSSGFHSAEGENSDFRSAEGEEEEYFLGTDTVNGRILKIYSQNGVVTNEVFYSGLLGPIKLLVRNRYVYVVEGGDLINFNNNTGRISRISLDTGVMETLVSGLNKPEGLDIYDGIMYFVEVGTRRILTASSHAPSQPRVFYTGLDLYDTPVLSQLNPYPVYPFAGLTVSDKYLWVSQYGKDNVNILQIKTC